MALYNKIDRKVLKEELSASEEARTTLSFYQYYQITDPEGFRNDLYQQWEPLGVYGRVYVAKEGINAQISVPEANFERFRDQLYQFPWLKGVRLNIAIEDDGKSFYKLKIKVREKIVADGLDDESFDVTQRGEELDAVSFNELTDQPETLIVDMRNHYESEVGHFEGALLPDADTFRDALPLVEDWLKEDKDRPIVMYCTGGIRCEKASAYFKHKGFKRVYQLEGGIIEYARQVAQKGLKNKFLGKNFVFDERLGERISGEVIAHCHQCGTPCDTHVNCANEACNLLFIQCESCNEQHQGCCSEECHTFISLPLEEQKERRKGISQLPRYFKKGRFELGSAFRKRLEE